MNLPMITRYEDVLWALRHPEIFSSDMAEETELGNERPMIPQQIDPPAHARYRRLLDPLFSRRRSLGLEPEVRRQANALIDKVIDEGECEFNGSFAIPLSCSVFLSLFGLPYADLDQFLDMKDGIIRPQAKTQGLEEMAKIRKDASDRTWRAWSCEWRWRNGIDAFRTTGSSLARRRPTAPAAARCSTYPSNGTRSVESGDARRDRLCRLYGARPLLRVGAECLHGRRAWVRPGNRPCSSPRTHEGGAFCHGELHGTSDSSEQALRSRGRCASAPRGPAWRRRARRVPRGGSHRRRSTA